MSSIRIRWPHSAKSVVVCKAIIAASFMAGAAFAGPVLPLRDVGLSFHGDFDRGCAFVGQRLYCWGSNLNGNLGIGTVSQTSLAEWVRRPDLASGEFDRPTSVTVSNYTCVSDAAGVWCWGLNVQGQLGLGDLLSRTLPVLVPGLPHGVLGVTQGTRHTCAHTLAAGVWCWGGNGFGETGQPPAAPLPGQVVPAPQLLAIRVPSLPAAISAVGLGDQYSCALASGRVWCWGRNDRGQLGDGSVLSRSQPAVVGGLPANITLLTTSPRHACAVDAAGDVWCWGSNESAEIGVAPTSDRLIESTPVRVNGLAGRATALHLDLAQSCVVVAGVRTCWGVADNGSALGATPVALPPPADAPAEWLDGCFSRAGELQCPGGHGRYPGALLDAQAVAGLSGAVTQLALGRDFACALLTDGGVWCWGDNARGQLGQGDLAARSTALRVPLPTATGLIAGARHACAVTAEGLWCWGANDTGALGDGTLVDRTTPVRAQNSGRLLGAGDGFTCAYADAGGLRCWGRNDVGQARGTSSAPILDTATPLGAAVIVELSLGTAHVCAVIQLGAGTHEVRCWGNLPVTTQEAATGVTNFAPRLVTAGAPLRDGNPSLLRSTGFSTCAGDRCFGLNYVPPDRGERRVDLLISLPTATAHAYALGGRQACVLGTGTDVQCAGLIGRACVVEQYLGLIQTPGQVSGCSFGESMLTALQRDWASVTGLPSTPRLLQSGEQYACAALASGVWCWGHSAPLNGSPMGAGFAPVYIGGAIAPVASIPIVLDPLRGCPAYLVSTVNLLNAARADQHGA